MSVLSSSKTPEVFLLNTNLNVEKSNEYVSSVSITYCLRAGVFFKMLFGVIYT